MTGGRLKRVLPYVQDDEQFCFTYGDGLSDLDIGALLRFHEASGRIATVTAVQPPGRFGAMRLDDQLVDTFDEKPRGDGSWMNGGFFVLSREVARYLGGDDTVWEQEPLRALARDRQLGSFRHTGFWHPMDTLRDRNELQSLWESGDAPWRRW
jgi:glucose-1-phosphate cytidylyltransferase